MPMISGPYSPLSKETVSFKLSCPIIVILGTCLPLKKVYSNKQPSDTCRSCHILTIHFSNHLPPLSGNRFLQTIVPNNSDFGNVPTS
ncbi:uncharacterized protein [Rutidosis leptorrhynchoides]|uniref:uncharacterized protein isoform X2 n=1 Tax=Rutidosis leptorrhynchoides TaxID=125765 RepID=UPI003A990AF8